MTKMVHAGFLRTKVARRQLLLFVLCALVPISLLALIAYYHVTSQLLAQSHERLQQASKAIGQVVFQRLQMVDAELQLVMRQAAEGDSAVVLALRGKQTGLRSVSLAHPGRPAVVLFGKRIDPPTLTNSELAHLRKAKSLLVQAPVEAGQARSLMARLLDPTNERRGVVWAEVSPADLFDFKVDIDLPPNTELCVLRDHGELETCIGGEDVVVRAELAEQVIGGAVREFEWESGSKQYVAGAFGLFLKAEFLSQGWTFVLSESRESILAPLARFKMSFWLILLLSLWVVLLLSNVQIRRSLQPLERLQEGTLRIARREFQTPVEVTSGDEFQDLAESFNAMSHRLDRQFRALATANEIDRSVLASLNREDIVDTILRRAPEVVPCSAVAVMVRDAEADRVMTSAVARGTAERSVHAGLRFSPGEANALATSWSGLEFQTDDLPDYLRPASETFEAITTWLVFPVFLPKGLAGGVAFGYIGRTELSEDDRTQASHLADQIAVGLSNANLIAELDSLNLGALTALARVIDAKSPWTAGHSERVTEIAVGIATQLGLDKAELETIRRGGLLHDIGKVAVPAEILDKPGRLTAEEMQVMQTHVTVGARILEPIPQYAAVLPIVLHHHERFDGKGYPHGLAGHAIHLHARIMAVADNFDALSSERPYRAGLEPAITLSIIRDGAGKEFDPVIVDAFFRYLAASAPEVLEAAEAGQFAALGAA